MHLTTDFEISSSTLFIRFNALEFFAERHSERAPEGWLSVTRPVAGEVVLSVGRWALHFVNHGRVAAGYATR